MQLPPTCTILATVFADRLSARWVSGLICTFHVSLQPRLSVGDTLREIRGRTVHAPPCRSLCCHGGDRDKLVPAVENIRTHPVINRGVVATNGLVRRNLLRPIRAGYRRSDRAVRTSTTRGCHAACEVRVTARELRRVDASTHHKKRFESERISSRGCAAPDRLPTAQKPHHRPERSYRAATRVSALRRRQAAASRRAVSGCHRRLTHGPREGT